MQMRHLFLMCGWCRASFTSLSNKGKEKSHIAVHMGSVSLLEIKEDGEKKYDELSF